MFCCVCLLVVPAGNVWAAVNARSTGKKKVVSSTKSVTSPVVDVSQWGQLELKVTVIVTKTIVGPKTTKTFKVTSLGFPIYPQHTQRSAYISSQALPLLRQEVLQLKGTTLQLVSGATATSYGFVEALRGALSKAGAF